MTDKHTVICITRSVSRSGTTIVWRGTRTITIRSDTRRSNPTRFGTRTSGPTTSTSIHHKVLYGVLGVRNRLFYFLFFRYTPFVCVFSSLGVDVERGNTHALINSTGHVLWVPPVRYRVHCKTDMTRWPYDVQTGYLKVGSWVYSGRVINMTETTALHEVCGRLSRLIIHKHYIIAVYRAQQSSWDWYKNF